MFTEDRKLRHTDLNTGAAGARNKGNKNVRLGDTPDRFFQSAAF